ncbi:MAG: hypothetical protein ACYTG1_02080 [Planctomycetota bacterium]|jgi:hypothetical protein
MKRTIPLLIGSIAGFVMIVAYFIPYTETWGEVVSIWFDILAAIAFILGGGNLLKIHLKKVSDRAAGWAYSVVTVVAFLATLTVGLGKIGCNPNELYPDKPWSGSYREIGSPFWWLFEYAFKPLTATMFAMLAFYVASAAFRAFRAKNIEAILLLGTAFIILLGRTFAGVFLTSWMPEALSGLRIENLTVYIMQVINTAGNRAIMIGIALGTASVSLKILLGVDRSHLGSGEE